MRFRIFLLRCLILGAVTLQALAPPAGLAGEPLGRLKRFFVEATYHGTQPETGQDGAMECLAENIDWLEHHIDTYGSVVAKQPDIWGEARLTKHRDEYERMMFTELGEFGPTINASFAQSDSSFLSQALALSAAATGRSVPGTSVADGASQKIEIDNVVAQLRNPSDLNAADAKTFSRFGITADDQKDNIKIEPTTYLDQMSRYLKHLHELRRINEGDDTSDSPGYSLNLVRLPVSILPGKLTRQGFGAEITVTAQPVISDDLMPTTFQNLVINDIVDFLGLPLVRVTERLHEFESLKSIDSFKATVARIDEIYARHRLDMQSNDDLKLQLIPEVETYLNNRLAVEVLTTVYTKFIDLESEQRGMLPSPRPARTFESPLVQDAVDEVFDQIALPQIQQLRAQKQAVEEAGQNAFRLSPSSDDDDPISIFTSLRDSIARGSVIETAGLLAEIPNGPSDLTEILHRTTKATLDALEQRISELPAAAPSGRARRALNPLNPSSLEPAMGIRNLVVAAAFFNKSYYGQYIRWSGSNSEDCGEQRVNLLDARRFLNAEVKAAYELLSEPAHLHLFAELAEPQSGLARQIRAGHFEGNLAGAPGVEAYRRYFFDQLHGQSERLNGADRVESIDYSGMAFEVPSREHSFLSAVSLADPNARANNCVEALAWAVVIEAALLNQRLNRDVEKLARSKEVFELQTEREQWFFLPDTVMTTGAGLEMLQSEFQQANEVFKTYVQARWPIHVFAVDPVAQDQNIADVTQRKRELQFALALGFTTGQIGVNSLTQYSRDLQTQIETIALNRTIVGFGHGTDTFGWRFYPRVQGLDAPGTLGALRETFMGTSRDYDLKNRKIEPGQRECVAVVLMPSFVPYADFDIRTNWFKLTNPKNSALTMKQTLKLSRAVTAMRNSRANCASCQHLYREGELRRLFKRVDQLDRELPLQTQRALVPYENTLGGFEMFNSGVTDLAPELIGWYGAPGVDLVDEACGCYQGCVSHKGDCDNPTNCNELKESIQSLNAVIAESPLAACQGKGTSLFLVGDNFSIHDTKVIAGGVCIPHVRLISRELMQVTIPHCVNTVELCENGRTDKYVAVYVATPYGVTNHLHVPVHSPSSISVVSRPTAPAMPVSQSVLAPPVAAGQTLSALRDKQISQKWKANRVHRPIDLVAFQSEESEASELMTIRKRLGEIESELRLMSLSSLSPNVDLSVNLPEMLSSESDTRHGQLNSPILGRLKTQVGEHWRNTRDSLPCF